LINFKKEEDYRDEIKRLVEKVKKEDEYYIKKAVDWLKRVRTST
jgi:3-methyladenine DNA glycosylase AlkD